MSDTDGDLATMSREEHLMMAGVRLQQAYDAGAAASTDPGQASIEDRCLKYALVHATLACALG